VETSSKGLELVKKFEGFSSTPYKDVGGRLTIGYGHLIKKGENFSRITFKEAEDLLRKDLKEAEDAVTKNVTVSLLQHQYDALVSFVYNLGGRRLASSTLLKKLNSGDVKGAANELPRWCNDSGKPVEGLRQRRLYEQNLFLGNV